MALPRLSPTTSIKLRLTHGKITRGVEERQVLEQLSYRFGVTVGSEDPLIIECLRALAQHHQKSGDVCLTLLGTSDQDWRNDDHQVTFRFTCPSFRAAFLTQAEELVPTDLWQLKAKNDDEDVERCFGDAAVRR